MDSTIREARLRLDFAPHYPAIPAGQWLPAAEAGALVLYELWARNPTLELPGRLLDPTHFEFRGGWDRGTQTALHTRANDLDGEWPEHPKQRRAASG